MSSLYSPFFQNIWYYAFTEIMNNAIEYSHGDRILLELRKGFLYTELSITDNGGDISSDTGIYGKELQDKDRSWPSGAGVI